MCIWPAQTLICSSLMSSIQLSRSVIKCSLCHCTSVTTPAVAAAISLCHYSNDRLCLTSQLGMQLSALASVQGGPFSVVGTPLQQASIAPFRMYNIFLYLYLSLQIKPHMLSISDNFPLFFYKVGLLGALKHQKLSVFYLFWILNIYAAR